MLVLIVVQRLLLLIPSHCAAVPIVDLALELFLLIVDGDPEQILVSLL